MSLGLWALALGVTVAVQAAAPVITNITMVGATPRFGVHSDLGITNQIQCCPNLSQTNQQFSLWTRWGRRVRAPGLQAGGFAGDVGRVPSPGGG